MNTFTYITVALWLAIMVVWVVSAFRAKRSTRTMEWQTSAMARFIIVIIFLLLMHFGAFQHLPPDILHNLTSQSNIWLATMGVILCAAGVGLAIWARVYLGRNWGMPMSLRQDHELVTSGPYAYVRHPIYSGIILGAIGSIFTIGTIWLTLVIAIGLQFAYSAKVEERMMKEQFPNEYPAYMKKT